MAMEKDVNLAHAQRPVPCDTCEEDEVPGTYYCIQCKKTLCEDCEKSHKKFTKDHKVILRTQIGEIDASILTCSDHKCEASFHCEKCNVPVCPECVIGKHQGHKMASLKDIIEKKKECLQGKIDEIQNVVVPKLVSLEETNNTERKTYNKNIEQLTKDMEDGNKVIHEELDRVHHEQLERLKGTHQNTMSLFHGRAEEIRKAKELFQSRVLEYQDAIAKNDIPSIIDLVERNESLPELNSKPIFPKQPSFVSPNIQTIVENLGELHIPYRSLMEKPIILSKFKSPLKGYPRIFITKEGNVWLGGNESKDLVMVDMNGMVLRKREIKKTPYNLASLDCGDVIMMPQSKFGHPVIRISADGNEHIVFDPSQSFCTGVSVSSDQKLIICTEDGRVVITNSKGTHIKDIYNCSEMKSTIHAVENTDSNIYISNWRLPGLVIINKDGKILSKLTKTVGGEMMKKPYDLVLDRNGNIVCTDQGNDCIYILDGKKELRELLDRSYCIHEPRDIVVDNDNNLWITSSTGNVFVVKYLE